MVHPSPSQRLSEPAATPTLPRRGGGESDQETGGDKIGDRDQREEKGFLFLRRGETEERGGSQPLLSVLEVYSRVPDCALYGYSA